MGEEERRTMKQWPQAFEEIENRIHHLFAQYQSRERAMQYIKGLLSPVERKNSWQLAEAAGEKDYNGPRFSDSSVRMMTERERGVLVERLKRI